MFAHPVSFNKIRNKVKSSTSLDTVTYSLCRDTRIPRCSLALHQTYKKKHQSKVIHLAQFGRPTNSNEIALILL